MFGICQHDYTALQDGNSIAFPMLAREEQSISAVAAQSRADCDGAGGAGQRQQAGSTPQEMSSDAASCFSNCK